MLIEGYLQTHTKIQEQIKVVDELVKKGNLADNAMDIGREISKLSGMINLHLNSEDKFMYPKMAAAENKEVQNLAKKYQNEMAGLVDVFNTFKVKYNTKGHILENASTFAGEWKQIVAQLSKRIEREEKELYPKYQE